jgi:hypothetical protein
MNAFTNAKMMMYTEEEWYNTTCIGLYFVSADGFFG